MALGLEDKKAIVAEVNEAAKGALSAVVADSRGVTVEKMTVLRKTAREAGVYMRVVRNTLLRRAVEGTEYECLNDAFTGPTLIAFSNEHPALPLVCSKSLPKRTKSSKSRLALLTVSLSPQHKLIVWPRCRLTKKQLRS